MADETQSSHRFNYTQVLKLTPGVRLPVSVRSASSHVLGKPRAGGMAVREHKGCTG